MSGLSSSIQALTVVILLLVSLYLQYSIQPYNHSELNHMETEALFTASLTIYCGLYYLTDLSSEAFKLVLFFFILSGNLYFVVYWVYYMFLAIVDFLVKSVPLVKRICKKGDAYEEEFYAEEISKQGTFIDKLEGVRNYTFLTRDKGTEVSMPELKNYSSIYREVFKAECGDHKNEIDLEDIIIEE